MPQFTINIDDKGKTGVKKTSKKRQKKALKKVHALPRDDSIKVRQEISSLETKKGQVGKGWRGMLKKASINKSIYERKQYLGSREKLKSIKALTESTEARLKLEEAREKLHSLQQKRQVNFGDLGGFNTPTKKQLKFEDLF